MRNGSQKPWVLSRSVAQTPFDRYSDGNPSCRIAAVSAYVIIIAPNHHVLRPWPLGRPWRVLPMSVARALSPSCEETI